MEKSRIVALSYPPRIERYGFDLSNRTNNPITLGVPIAIGFSTVGQVRLKEPDNVSLVVITARCLVSKAGRC